MKVFELQKDISMEHEGRWVTQGFFSTYELAQQAFMHLNGSFRILEMNVIEEKQEDSKEVRDDGR